MPESKGVVKKIVEREGRILVSFPNHAGYFKLPPDMLALAVESKEKGRELQFTFDRELHITAIA